MFSTNVFGFRQSSETIEYADVDAMRSQEFGENREKYVLQCNDQ